MTAAPALKQGSLLTTDGETLPLKETILRGTLDGPVASLSLTQRFVNPRETAIEAVYSFPLPPEASVFEMRFVIADRVVEAVLLEKEAARRSYAAARSAGRAATLLEEASDDRFTLCVANVPPGAEVRVELGYQQRLSFDGGEWRFVFPMTAPERYVESAETRLVVGGTRGGQSYASARLPKLDELRPPRLPSGTRPADVRIELDVRAPGGAVEGLGSASHRVSLAGLDSGAQRVTLGEAASIANRDFVLSYRAGGAGVRPLLRFAREGDDAGTLLLALTPSSEDAATSTVPKDEGAMLAMRCANCGATVTDLSAIEQIPGLGPVLPCVYCHALLAPSTERTLTRAARPRDVTVLVDRSASMRGTGRAARAAVRSLLEALPPTDAIRVIACDHDREDFEDSLETRIALAPGVIDRVDAFLEAHPPRGGSEIERALEAAAALRPREGRTPVVVLLTDGNLGNEGRLLRRAEELLGESARLFVLGLGASPDARLIDRLARRCGGASAVMSGAADASVLERFVRKVREGGPVLTGLSVAFEGGGVEAALPRPIGDLYGGEPVFLLARYHSPEPTRITITGATADGQPFRQRILVELPKEASTPGLARLWARAEVERLTRIVDSGDARRSAKAKEQALALALEHSIVSRFTSLTASDSEVVSDGSPTRVEVPQGAEESLALLALEAELGCEDLGASPPSPRMCAPAPGAPPPPAAMAPAAFGAPPFPGSVAPGCAAPRPASPSPSKPRARRSRLAAGMKALADRVLGGDAAAKEECLDALEMDDEAPAACVTERLERARPARTGSRAPRAPSPSSNGGPSLFVQGADDYDPDELRWLKERASGELDLVFLVDETGSMGSYIAQVKQRLLALIDALRGLPLCDSLRLGLVTYRDHPPQDHSYASRAVELTDELGLIETQVQAMKARGGGDGPESVTDGLFDVVRMSWRPGAAKAVVWFGDAPPHGVEPSGDGFASGCPCGDHWYTQAESCREMGIAIYAVGCLPGLRAYVGAEEVFRTVATTSRGRYLPLTSAHTLVPLMAAAAASELDRRRVDAHVAEALQTYGCALEGTDRTERVRWLTERLRDGGVRARELKYTEGESSAALEARALESRDVEAALDRLELQGALR